MSKPILVAVDCGSGNVTVCFELNGELKKATIPARIRKGNAQSFDTEASTTGALLTNTTTKRFIQS
jgi:hypothetical protein